jgi:hypothetical protein
MQEPGCEGTAPGAGFRIASPRARNICMRGEERDLVRSAMLLPTELKRKVRPGYSFSSTPLALALVTVPSTVSTGALKWRWAT